VQTTSHEVSTSPLPPIAATVQRTSVPINTVGYVSPELQKPRTPYEDKVIPTLRNRNRNDAGPSIANNDVGKKMNDDTESISGVTNPTLNDDATAELNQAEMIEANQMMIVFDKHLVNITLKISYMYIFSFKD